MRKYLKVLLILFIISIACFFIDPYVPSELSPVKTIFWLILSPGIAFYKDTTFSMGGFVGVIIINLIWCLILAGALILIDKYFRKQDQA